MEQLGIQQNARVEDVEDAVIAVIYHRRLVVRELVGLLGLVEVNSLVEGRARPGARTRSPRAGIFDEVARRVALAVLADLVQRDDPGRRGSCRRGELLAASSAFGEKCPSGTYHNS